MNNYEKFEICNSHKTAHPFQLLLMKNQDTKHQASHHHIQFNFLLEYNCPKPSHETSSASSKDWEDCYVPLFRASLSISATLFLSDTSH